MLLYIQYEIFLVLYKVPCFPYFFSTFTDSKQYYFSLIERKEKVEMENKFINTQDVICAVAQEMFQANSELRLSSPDKFNRNLLKLLQQEIAKAKPAATYWKYMCPGSHEYTFTDPFPLAIYEELSPDFLTQLESAGIYLSKNKELGRAQIRIVFHF